MQAVGKGAFRRWPGSRWGFVMNMALQETFDQSRLTQAGNFGGRCSNFRGHDFLFSAFSAGQDSLHYRWRRLRRWPKVKTLPPAGCFLPFRTGGDYADAEISGSRSFLTLMLFRSFFQLMLGHQCSEPQSFQARLVFPDCFKSYFHK